jgi:hypothetical protein
MNYAAMIYHMLLKQYKAELSKETIAFNSVNSIDWAFVEAFEKLMNALQFDYTGIAEE